MTIERAIVGLMACLAVAGCEVDGDIETLEAEGDVGDPIRLQTTGPQFLDPDDVVVEWIIDEQPESGRLTFGPSTMAWMDVVANRPGFYVVDRWIRIAATERRTHRFEIVVGE